MVNFGGEKSATYNKRGFFLCQIKEKLHDLKVLLAGLFFKIEQKL